MKHQGKSRKIRRFTSALPTRFLRSQCGGAAVEFALVSIPFFLVIGACVENSLYFLQRELLQRATMDASRQIYTGRFQTSNADTTDKNKLLKRFQSLICSDQSGSPRTTIFDCANVRINISQSSTFNGVTPTEPLAVDPQGRSIWNPSFPKYDCTGSSAIVIIQSAVDIPVFFPTLGISIAQLPNNRRVIQAAVVIKNESYTNKSVCPS
jgi:hypothetical protein